MRLCSKLSAAYVVSTLAALLSSETARAMSIAFLVPDTTAGAASKGSFVVVNDSEKSLPVETDVSRIDLDKNGNFASEPARDKFLIFPRRADVPPGGRQKFFVQWIGDPHI